jgi:hypothetical protein
VHHLGVLRTQRKSTLKVLNPLSQIRLTKTLRSVTEEQEQRYCSQSAVEGPAHTLRVLSAYVAGASLVELRALSFNKEWQSLWLYMPTNDHHASIPAQGERSLLTINK